MCAAADISPSKAIQANLGVVYAGPEMPGKINVRPTDPFPVIDDSSVNELKYKTWGLIPWHSTTGKMDYKRPTFNARSENILTSPVWKQLIGNKHCVFICKNFYEWSWLDDKGKKKQPHMIKSVEGPFTFMAGLWEDWVNKQTGEVISSCSMITNPANEMMAKIHNGGNNPHRMPAFLTWENAKLWLDNDISIQDRLQLIKPVENDFLKAIELKKVGDEEEYQQLAFC
ncbi:SOS response-associated peptidase [Pedobacter sp. SYSU D00535]|uniref:SOS response-associated peptidase n=1 Tax=Pedobacter sp. SYSU D00535 TaxID=2810308 RepID=UPI001A95FFB3|nr:SOS response-associated peptidase [Pedobacter sp. SYSU D00535]